MMQVFLLQNSLMIYEIVYKFSRMAPGSHRERKNMIQYILSAKTILTSLTQFKNYEKQKENLQLKVLFSFILFISYLFSSIASSLLNVERIAIFVGSFLSDSASCCIFIRRDSIFASLFARSCS